MKKQERTQTLSAPRGERSGLGRTWRADRALATVVLVAAGAVGFGACASTKTSERAASFAACDQLPEAATSRGLLAENVTAVAPLTRERRVGKTAWQEPAGAKLHVPAAPGVTGAWLERVAMCQIGAPDARSDDPLAVPGALVRVAPAPAGYLVEISAADRDAAKEILRRAEALASR